MTKQINLGNGKVALVDDLDYEMISSHTWYEQFGYARRTPNKHCSVIRMHNMIMEPPEGLCVDHKNGDGLDNRRDNLRLCTMEQNQQNRRMSKRNSSGYIGVCLRSGRETRKKHWRATIHFNGETVNIGLFFTAEEAAKARDKAAIKHHGDFAVLNFPRSDYE